MEEKIRKARNFFKPHIPRFSAALGEKPALLVAIHEAVADKKIDVPVLKQIGARFLKRDEATRRKIIGEMHDAWQQHGARAALQLAEKRLPAFQFEASAYSDVGKKRRDNQDYYHISRTNNLFVVADGMGGHSDGEIASELATTTLANHFDPAKPHSLAEGIEQAHTTVRQEARKRFSNMGTTLTALHISPSGTAHIAHAGDSRIYRLREKLEQLTQDHTVAAELIKGGWPAAAVPDAFKSSLTKGVGTRHIDVVNPQVGQHDVQHNDVYLLCSDGLTNEVSEADIQKVLEKVRREKINTVKASKILVRLANRTLGRDNITALVVKVKKS